MSTEAHTLAWSPRAPRAPRAPLAPVRTDTVTWLIDNAEAYRAIVASIRGARDTIRISQLALDADCLAYDVEPAATHDAGSTTIVRELIDATRRGVEVCVLLNASLLLDTVKPLRAHLAAVAADSRRFRVRGVSAFPQLLHAKMVLVDDAVAILVGSPFANGYWDDSRHAPIDSRRPMRELGGRPVHDVSTQVHGPAVGALSATFAAMWNSASDIAANDRGALPIARAPRRTPDQNAVRVVRTAPGDGPMETLSALLDGLDRARRLVYIEHQYLSARPVVDALGRAVARRPALEVVIVLNQNPDVTAYRGWQNTRLRESGLLAHPRVGVFTLWTSALDPLRGRRQISQVFVHSKVVTIDDRWALVGSANLDGVSLHSYGDDFSGAIGRRVFRGVRNFDVGVVVDGEADREAAHQVRGLRRALWHEHLRGAADDRSLEGGGLTRWRSQAQRNVDELAAGVHANFADGPFVLPYSTRSTPRAQLAHMGVVFAPDTIELCFEPSWLEVHASPNWVRNMFG